MEGPLSELEAAWGPAEAERARIERGAQDADPGRHAELCDEAAGAFEGLARAARAAGEDAAAVEADKVARYLRLPLVRRAFLDARSEVRTAELVLRRAAPPLTSEDVEALAPLQERLAAAQEEAARSAEAAAAGCRRAGEDVGEWEREARRARMAASGIRGARSRLDGLAALVGAAQASPGDPGAWEAAARAAVEHAKTAGDPQANPYWEASRRVDRWNHACRLLEEAGTAYAANGSTEKAEEMDGELAAAKEQRAIHDACLQAHGAGRELTAELKSLEDLKQRLETDPLRSWEALVEVRNALKAVADACEVLVRRVDEAEGMRPSDPDPADVEALREAEGQGPE